MINKAKEKSLTFKFEFFKLEQLFSLPAPFTDQTTLPRAEDLSAPFLKMWHPMIGLFESGELIVNFILFLELSTQRSCHLEAAPRQTFTLYPKTLFLCLASKSRRL